MNTIRRNQALRQIILAYNQWPGNNPWSMGGQLLLGHPGVGLISVRGLLGLVFGSIWCLNLAAPVYLIIGLWRAFWGNFIRTLLVINERVDITLAKHNMSLFRVSVFTICKKSLL